MGNIWRLAEGLNYAANPDGNIYTNDGADIINLSLGTTEKTFLIREFLGAITNDERLLPGRDYTEIRRHKIVVVAAAGNTGDATRIYPAAEQTGSLIAVAASNSQDLLTIFSTRGNWVSLMAPGEEIVSAMPNGRFATWRGTSMAAPVVSGIAALVMVRHPNMTADRVAAHIRGTSTDVTDSMFLRVDAARALTINPVP
jgi:subtilisin family serine protease